LNFVSYYVVGLPLSLMLAFSYHYGIFGLWWGMTLGYFTSAILYTNLIARADWKKESTIAQERVREDLEKLKNDIERSARYIPSPQNITRISFLMYSCSYSDFFDGVLAGGNKWTRRAPPPDAVPPTPAEWGMTSRHSNFPRPPTYPYTP